MAKVYRHVAGMKIEKAMAMQVDVQRSLSLHGMSIAYRARGNLARHRKTGNAKVRYQRGTIDRWIILADTGPTKDNQFNKAMTIEYGRAPSQEGEPNHPGSSPTNILAEAAGLPGHKSRYSAARGKSFTKLKYKRARKRVTRRKGRG